MLPNFSRILFSLSVVLIALRGPLAAQSAPDFIKAREEAIKRLQEMVPIDTSNPPGNETKLAEYIKGILDKEGIDSKIIGVEPTRGNIVARIKGNGKKKPLLMMGHMDVVGVERDKWTVDPFVATIKDGYIYGRGTIDDKGHLNGMLQTLLMIHRQKLPLDRDIIFLGEAGEEGGPPVGIDFLIEKHWPEIECEYALNEGAQIHQRDGQGGGQSGGKIDYVGIQTGEKVPRGMKLVAHGVSGHGSIPRMDNPIYRLAAAIQKVAEYQPPMRLNETTRVFFQRLAQVSPPDEAFLFSHLEDPAIGSMVQEKLRRSKNEAMLMYNSMLRTSISPNIVQGGIRVNVVPATAEVTLDIRALPDENMEQFVAELKRIIDDAAVEIVQNDWTSVRGSYPSRLDSDLYKSIEKAQTVVFPSAVTVPIMSTGATDSAALRAKGVQAFGVGTVATDDDEGRMHGNDERISIDGYGKFLEFVYRAVIDVAGAK